MLRRAQLDAIEEQSSELQEDGVRCSQSGWRPGFGARVHGCRRQSLPCQRGIALRRGKREEREIAQPFHRKPS